MIPMNCLVIIETSKCIPDYSRAVPFSPLQVEEVQFLQA